MWGQVMHPAVSSPLLASAVAADDPNAVAYYLNENAQADQQDWSGATLLHRCRSLQVLRLLLEAGADPNRPDTAGRFPVEAALARGERAVAWTLFEASSIPAHRLPVLLRLACDHPSSRVVSALLEAGVCPNAADGKGRTPLFRLLRGRHALSPEAVRVACDLVDAGANWDAATHFGSTPRDELRQRHSQAWWRQWGWKASELFWRAGGLRPGSRRARLNHLVALSQKSDAPVPPRLGKNKDEARGPHQNLHRATPSRV